MRLVAVEQFEELLVEVTAAVNRGVYADRWPEPAEGAEMRARLS